MYSIKPDSKNSTGEFEIRLKDFISIFKIDEVGDHVIKMIN